jgi:hypothetical protein
MLSNQDPDHIKRVKRVSYELNIPEEVVEMSLSYMSEYIKNKISQIELVENLTEEDFDKLYPTIKMPGSIGYLRPSYQKYTHINKNKNK